MLQRPLSTSCTAASDLLVNGQPSQPMPCHEDLQNFTLVHIDTSYNVTLWMDSMQDKVNKDNFPQRLTAMIETHPECPPGTYGRLPFILAQLAKVTSNVVSPETVRKWLAGEAHPRRERVIALAQAFGADPAWLEHGYEKEARDASAIPDMSSEMMYVLGALELSGASVAFAGAGDGYDLRAIAGRHSIDLTILRGEYKDEDTVRVDAPAATTAPGTRLIAVVPVSGGLPEVFDLVDPVWPFKAVRGARGLIEKNENHHARVLDLRHL
jgi:transcriptional regulator with XRE-family HTH domain